ncbi:MAG: methylated-DNA--[protein]-cysteine S-methyltransferase [Draconibacterium sp.]|nr:methylated-DNA--[protein]-cysteine S-methyltransferase [Draconibacterium sp.]
MGTGFFMEIKHFIKFIQSPIGWLKIETNQSALIAVSFVDGDGGSTSLMPDIITKASEQLLEYFEGKRKVFNLKLSPQGTEFQKKVWNHVSKINYGETTSYLDIAKHSGSEKNTRAVGLANGKNPIPIFIPCHRIIGTDGKLTGYAGGLEKKRWLLQHELENSEKPGMLF